MNASSGALSACRRHRTLRAEPAVDGELPLQEGLRLELDPGDRWSQWEATRLRPAVLEKVGSA